MNGRVLASMACVVLCCLATPGTGVGQDVAEPARPAVQKFELEGSELKLPGPVVFETGSSKLKPESTAVLQLVKDYLNAKSYVTLLRIEGHADGGGDPNKALELTSARAMAVARWLVAQGVDCKRVLPVGFGDSKPIAPNDTAENKARNRRISFVNAALRGLPIGGMPVEGGGQVAGDACGR